MTIDPTLDRARIDEAVSAERLALADLVAGLTDEQWTTASLCSAWTVRDVIAHLTVTTRASVAMVIGGAVRARGSFDRMEIDLAARRASRYTTSELVAQLRESASSNRRFPMSGPMDPLMDLVVHAQDVARPLGITYDSPPAARSASLAYLAANKLMGGPKRISGLRIESTDTGWSHGDGPVVRGPDSDMLLVVTGRRAGLDGLSGPGTTRLAERL